MKLTLTALALTLATTLLPLTSASGFPGENGRLTYSDGGIVTSNPDGTDVVRLTDSSADVNSAWSADGSKLVYVCDDQICTMNADGSDQVQITDDPSINFGHPAWSPNGERIVHRRRIFVEGFRRLQGTLWIMDADGTNAFQLTDSESANPAWSPDGRRIVFTRGYIGGNGVWTIQPDGSRLKKLVEEGYTTHPVWSPSGRRVAFLLLIHDHWRLWTVGRSGVEAKEIFKSDKDEFTGQGLSWSPDGRSILLSDQDGTLFTVTRSGTSRQNLDLLGRQQDWAPATP